MQRLKRISGWQFAAFRIVLGLCLVQHFAILLLQGPDVFPPAGHVSDRVLNGILPNPLERWDTPAFGMAWLAAMLGLSALLALGVLRRSSCVLLWFGWACLLHRHNLTFNASIPSLGLVLLLTALVPPGEPMSLPVRRSEPGRPWRFPAMLFVAAWAIMALGYTLDGLDRLLTVSVWRDGSAPMRLLHDLLRGPEAFHDHVRWMPQWIMPALGWSVGALELLFLPLCMTRRSRLVAWALMLGVHLGMLAVFASANLVFGLVMLHLFTFDPDWFPPRASRRGRSVVFYDGVCGLCHRTVQFLIGEDHARVLTFAPLQGPSFDALRIAADPGDADSLVYARGFGEERPQVAVRSTAVLRALDDVGGFWRVVSWGRVIPPAFRDRLYDFVARHRYRWFGRSEQCRLPTPQQRDQLLP